VLLTDDDLTKCGYAVHNRQRQHNDQDGLADIAHVESPYRVEDETLATLDGADVSREGGADLSRLEPTQNVT